MQYRAGYQLNSNTIADIFDGELYKKLLMTRVMVGGENMSFDHFSDTWDIALGLSTDSFALHKRRTMTAWPIILFNYNLPPDVQFHQENIIPMGTIPGPKKPQDFDSFIWPLMEELLQLELGVKAYDVLSKTLFALHVYLIVCFGDIPAMSLLMRMKGHNACLPCHMCKIIGVHGPYKTYYVPLNRANCNEPFTPSCYEPSDLPIHTHNNFINEACCIQFSPNSTTAEDHTKTYGIKGIPVLSVLSSLTFPSSFPYDFMHLVWENLIPNLISLWMDKFKNLSLVGEEHVLGQGVLREICATSVCTGDTIPALFGCHVPDLEKHRGELTADSATVWMLYIAPIVLRGRFKRDKYYNHFIDLVDLLNLCLDYELPRDKVAEIEDGFVQWVKEYERLYYQFDPTQLPMCPLTIHALLHIGPSIRAMGPAWAYWAFPMECYCGKLSRNIKNRWYPFISLNNYISASAHLTHVQSVYNLYDEISFELELHEDGQFKLEHYIPYVLKLPRSNSVLPDHIWKMAIAHLVTSNNVTAASVRHSIPHNTPVVQYGRVVHLGSGDGMQCHDLVNLGLDERDTSFVQYYVYVDKFAHQWRKQPVFECHTFYGQLLRILVVEVPADISQSKRRETVLLAVICDVKVKSRDPMLNIVHYKDMGPVTVVDLKTVECVVGRVYDHGSWAIVDRHPPSHSPSGADS
ncbi:hypothetical protein APHAL10511_004258 [Amanita phalloides]|nr:hypothetical protein APHAL10511_004258 [Amanita phalloides]